MSRRIVVILIVVLLVGGGGGAAWYFLGPTYLVSLTPGYDEVIRLDEVWGQVKVLQPESSSYVAAENGMMLEAGGQVTTLADGHARVTLPEGPYLRLSPQTSFTLRETGTAPEEAATRLALHIGSLWATINGGAFEIETPSGVATANGGSMSVSYNPASGLVRVTCLANLCRLSNAQGEVHLAVGETAIIPHREGAATPGCMTMLDSSYWLLVNPETTRIAPAVTAMAPLCRYREAATAVP